MNISKLWMVVALLLLGTLAVHASSGHITLLTVADENGTIGGTADLYLAVKPGTGAIFIDSFPLTKVDTQSSVRYANQIACDLLQTDCSRYDFFYTIRADSAIVGGPSAGGAIAVLTVAALDGQDIDQHTAMTGTINSGGIIGPVAGVPAKIRGAKTAGMTKVLIPALTDENVTNISGVTVTRVSTVEEALKVFTGKDYRKALQPLKVPSDYTSRMHLIADEICNRTQLLKSEVAADGLQYDDTHNYTKRILALDGYREYSRASLCFSMNIELASLSLQNQSQGSLNTIYRRLRIDAKNMSNDLRGRNITTIGDLETYAIVEERIIEAQQILDDIEPTNISADSLAYAQERLVSAKSWEEFFGMPGKNVQISSEYLQRACLAKLSEAEERVNYVRLYTPDLVAASDQLVEDARGYSMSDPILCIFTAAKAKAQANLLANAISIDRRGINTLVDEKIGADKLVLQKQQEKGFFPILGYSYTQYAVDLRDTAPYSALTFSEYALELSNLDMYFPKNHSWSINPEVLDQVALFFFGALFGVGVTMFILGQKTQRIVKKR